MILTLIVGNGDWWRPRVDVGLGVYVLEAATSGVGHVGFPAAYVVALMSGATAWRFGGLTFVFPVEAARRGP